MRTRLPVWSVAFLVSIVSVSSGRAQFSQALSIIPTGQTPTAGGSSDSWSPVVSPDGRYVLFASTANNLFITTNNTPIPDRFPAVLNVYLRDRTSNTTALVSINTSGVAGGNDDSLPLEVSTNGRYALFQSNASDLVPSDTNNVSDVFVRDLQTKTTILVSVSTNGSVGNGASRNPVMSADGRYVAFVSAANNLVAGDTNQIPDIFVRDLQAQTTVIASVGALSTNSITALGSSEAPVISPDGRYVAFFSTATNLVAGVPPGGDVYLRDLVAGTTAWASTGARAALLNVLQTNDAVSYNIALSADGQFVAYETSSASKSGSSGIILRYQVASGVTDLVHTNAEVQTASYEDVDSLDMTPDGRFIAFIANTNGTDTTCVELWDASTSIASLISGDPTGQVPQYSTCDWPAINPSGRFVAFLSDATALTTNVLSVDYNIYVRDTQRGTLTLVNADTTGGSSSANPVSIPVLTADGQWVGFDGDDGNLVPFDNNKASDVFFCPINPGTNELVSAHEPSLFSLTANGLSSVGPGCLSADGRYVAFESDADNLTFNDTNSCVDVFVRDQLRGTTTLVSVGTNGANADAPSAEEVISADGRFVAFSSTADNLVPGDNNSARDVFIRDLQAGTTTLVSVNNPGTGSGNGDSSAPLISANGRYVFFSSTAQNLAPVSFNAANLFVRDLQAGKTIALTTSGFSSGPVISQDGKRFAYALNLGPQTVCVYDLSAGRLIYSNTQPYLIGYDLSGDGNSLALSLRSNTANYLEVVSLATSANQIVESNSTSVYQNLGLSADGGKLVCTKAPSNGPGTKQVFIFDVASGAVQLVSHSQGGGPSAGNSDSPQINADGRFVIYRSDAPDMVPNDTNGQPDLFLYDQQTGSNTLLSISLSSEGSGNNRSLTPFFSPDGKSLVYCSWASDLVGKDFNNNSDVFGYSLLYISIVPSAALSQGPWLTWPYVAGKNYKIQYRTGSPTASWQDLGEPYTNSGNRAWLQDRSPSGDQRVYRVIAF